MIIRSLRVHRIMGLVGTLALVLAAVPVAAQSETLNVDVPFDFVVGDTTLPAGTYEVEIGIGKTDPPVLAFQTRTTPDGDLVYKKVMVMASPGDVSEDGPRLVFREVGDLHFLEKVVSPSGKVKEVQ